MSNPINAMNFACALLVLFYDSDGVARKRVDSHNGNKGSNPVRVATDSPIRLNKGSTGDFDYRISNKLEHELTYGRGIPGNSRFHENPLTARSLVG
jgi:hypothetical protein